MAADCVQADGTDVNSVIVTATTGNAMVEGQSIYIGASYGDSPSAGISTYNVITAIEKCDVDGTLDDAGTYRLITFDGTARTVTGGITQIASRPWLTGSTNKVLGHTGSPVANNNKYPCKYRWLENPYGNINKTCLDLMDVRVEDGDTYKLQWYYNPALMHEGGAKYYPSSTSKPDTADLANEAYGWELLGVETPAESYVNGYIREEGADAKYPCVRVPIKTVGGSSTTYYCDYAPLVSSHVVRAVRRRGNLLSGSIYGPRYVYAYYAPSYGYWAYGGGLFMAQ